MRGQISNPSGLCKCGCGEPAPLSPVNRRTTGHVKGQPLNYIRGHNPRRKQPGYQIQDTGFLSPCWLWTGTLNCGYGMIGARKAHRVFYEEVRGTLARGIDLHHLCHQPSCVNPDHLEPIGHGQHQHRHRGAHVSAVADQVKRAAGSQREIAARFGIAKTTVARIQNGSWYTD